MKMKLEKIAFIALCLATIFTLSSCFKKYDIKEQVVINPTIETTIDWTKIERATRETTTEVPLETITEESETTIYIEETTKATNEMTTETNATSTEETNKETEIESKIETEESNIEDLSLSNTSYVPKALLERAPDTNANILTNELTQMVENKGWTYGKSPISWVYVRPNTRIVSNYRPNGSLKYSIKGNAMSGEYGCFIPIFSNTNNVDEYYEGRFYCFDDYTKDTPNSFRWTNGLNDLKVEGFKVLDILKLKYPDLVELKKGLYQNLDEYINIVYVEELYEILNNNR